MTSRYLVNFNVDQLPQEESDLLIIGGGIAGLYTAWKAVKKGLKVTVLTKRTIVDSNSDRAQGGIAVALGKTDSPELHYQDTIMAGAGLCDPRAVNILVNEGPRRVQELIQMGADFDHYGDGLSMTKEGAHSKRRILHAHGDATGAEIMRTLIQKVTEQGQAQILEQHMVVDLLVEDNVCHGLLAYDEDSGQFRVYWAKAIVLASGGAGQLFKNTTNPDVATGDGIAIAYRAGAEVMDMEFMQFHPTALVLPGAPRFLITESVRGEGGRLRNSNGELFMPRYHGMADLAPRDIVSRSILSEMANTGKDCVYLDLTHLSGERIKERFPTITSTCAKYNLDITQKMIPVAPAAHYIMGGIKTDCFGATSIQGLFACGEAACLGVHGANRLASNSLLDGLVYGNRSVQACEKRIRSEKVARPTFSYNELQEPTADFIDIRQDLKKVMGANVGPLRTAQRLSHALAFFERNKQLKKYSCSTPRELELRNMMEVGQLIAEAAMMRTESRGGHFRLDYPETRELWQKHIIIRR